MLVHYFDGPAVKQFIDFIPLILFLIVTKMDPRPIEVMGYTWQLGGIISATAVLIAASIVVYGTLLAIHKRLDKSQWFTLAASVVFGSLTVFLHDDTFIKWKAPIVNWTFALVFLGSQFIGEKPIIQRIMGHAVSLPSAALWSRLNLAWVVFFIVCGGANLYVALHYDFWVDFKLFGSLAMTVIFMIGQSFFLYRHMQSDDKSKLSSKE